MLKIDEGKVCIFPFRGHRVRDIVFATSEDECSTHSVAAIENKMIMEGRKGKKDVRIFVWNEHLNVRTKRMTMNLYIPL